MSDKILSQIDKLVRKAVQDLMDIEFEAIKQGDKEAMQKCMAIRIKLTLMESA